MPKTRHRDIRPGARIRKRTQPYRIEDRWGENIRLEKQLAKRAVGAALAVPAPGLSWIGGIV
jgi:hypothetical protein